MAGFLGEKEVLTRERVKQILRNKQYSYLEEKVSLLEVRTDSLLLKISFLSEYHKRMISIEAKEPIVIPLKDFKIEDWGDGPDVQVTGRCLRGNEQYKRCLGVKRYRLPMLAWEGGTSTVTRIRGRIFELLYDRCLLCIFDFLFLSVKRFAVRANISFCRSAFMLRVPDVGHSGQKGVLCQWCIRPGSFRYLSTNKTSQGRTYISDRIARQVDLGAIGCL
ncbi:MAG TPA: hypothetical protein VE616_14760 [Candidatus Udaeobacter sp.]|jgi:hypothetical protein|nr:hypothetical protein [Candidatus Udaeobacter sp.]